MYLGDIARFVKLAGDQIIAGVKTFTSSPIAPTPSSSDDSTKVATTAWVRIGFAFSFGANGYIKFPGWLGGFIIQWGSVGAGTAVTFPLTFPNAVYKIAISLTSGSTNAPQTNELYISSRTTSGFSRAAQVYGVEYIAVGY